MSKLKDFIQQPIVMVDGRKYINEEAFKEYFIEKLVDEKLDCDNQDKKDGINIAIQCIMNS